jgi:hypothetical protein
MSNQAPALYDVNLDAGQVKETVVTIKPPFGTSYSTPYGTPYVSQHGTPYNATRALFPRRPLTNEDLRRYQTLPTIQHTFHVEPPLPAVPSLPLVSQHPVEQSFPVAPPFLITPTNIGPVEYVIPVYMYAQSNVGQISPYPSEEEYYTDSTDNYSSDDDLDIALHNSRMIAARVRIMSLKMRRWLREVL